MPLKTYDKVSIASHTERWDCYLRPSESRHKLPVPSGFLALGGTMFYRIRAKQIRSDFSRRLGHSEKMPLPFIAIV